MDSAARGTHMKFQVVPPMPVFKDPGADPDSVLVPTLGVAIATQSRFDLKVEAQVTKESSECEFDFGKVQEIASEVAELGEKIDKLLDQQQQRVHTDAAMPQAGGWRLQGAAVEA